jgi:site-specific recombinase XerD
MSPLRQKFIDEMKLRNFSVATVSSYTGAVAALAGHYHRSPDKISEQEIKQYLLFLTEEKKLTYSTCNVAISAFKLFYNDILGQGKILLKIPLRKTTKRLPEVLSTKEVERIFQVEMNPKHRVLLMTTYAAGLRVSEVTRLKIKDIESQRNLIRVDQGKGKKDRYTVLSPRLLEELRSHYVRFRPQEFLFYGTDIKKPLSRSAAQRIYYKAKKKAGITRGGGIHCLRHCFATHMLEAGMDIRTLQIILGHASLSSTAMYLHITMKHLGKTQSPFDLLDISDFKNPT